MCCFFAYCIFHLMCVCGISKLHAVITVCLAPSHSQQALLTLSTCHLPLATCQLPLLANLPHLPHVTWHVERAVSRAAAAATCPGVSVTVTVSSRKSQVTSRLTVPAFLCSCCPFEKSVILPTPTYCSSLSPSLPLYPLPEAQLPRYSCYDGFAAGCLLFIPCINCACV